MMRTPWFVGQRTVQLAAWAHTNGLPLTRARLPALLHEFAIDELDSGIRLAKTFDGVGGGAGDPPLKSTWRGNMQAAIVM